MESEQKPPEERILEVGNKLLNERPSSVDELLCLLDEVDNCLANVEQSPSMSMLAALQPSKEALVAKELLGHSDINVKTAVASCVSEITRITAPDAPYDDDLMKEIFQMIVTTFENLHDMSSCSYSKRTSILETMAKVRAAVVMLDLECDALILQMFNHFLKSIRDEHPDTVFSFMETIMTLVLEESEAIPFELISCLLASVKKVNQDILPVASRLAEKVISNCSLKLKPYLNREVESGGISLDDYNKVVASVCQEKSDKLEPEKPEPKNDLAADRSSMEVMGNGMAEMVKDESLEGHNSLEKDSEPSHNGNQLKITVATTEEEPGLLDSKTIKLEAVQEGEPDQIIEKAGNQKSLSEINSSETTVPAHTDHETKKADDTLSGSPPVKEASDLLDDEKGSGLPSPSESYNKTVNAAEQLPNQSLPGSSQRKRGRPKKGGMDAEVVLPSSQEKLKGSLSSDQIDDNAPQSAEIKSSKASEGNADSEAKAQRKLVEKVNECNENQAEVALDKNQRKGGRPRAKKGGTIEKDDLLGLPTEQKGTLSSNHIEEDPQQSTEIKSSKKPEGNSNSEIEALRSPVEKVNGEDNNQHEMSCQGTQSKKETEGASGSEGVPLEHMAEKSPLRKAIIGGPSKKHRGDKKKLQNEAGGSSGSEGKPLERMGEKSSPRKAIMGGLSKKHRGDKNKLQTEAEGSSGSGGEPLERLGEKSPAGKTITGGPSKKHKGDKKKLQTEAEGSIGSEGKPLEHMPEKSPPRKAITVGPSKKHKGDKKKPQAEAEGSSGSEGEPLERMGGKSPLGKVITIGPSKKQKGDKKKLQAEAEVSSNSEGEPLGRMGGKSPPGKAITGEPSKKHKGDQKKLQTEAVAPRDRTPRESTKKKMVSSSKSATKRSDEGQIYEAKSKRKHLLASEKQPHADDLDENLVGRRIKVFWPMDKMFYKGTIETSIGEKHKVVYDDGDVEVLDLKNEKWELVDADLDAEETAERESTDASDKPKKKKLKTSSDPLPKHLKITPLKRGRGSSSGKSTVDPAKRSRKSLNDGTKLGSKLKTDGANLESKSEDDTPKIANKSKDASRSNKLKEARQEADEKSEGDTPEGGGKSKDGLANTGGKLKANTPKAGGKPKGNTPKAGSKPEDNTSRAGSDSKGKPSKTRRKSKEEDAPSAGRKSQDDTPELSKEGPLTKGMSDSAKRKDGADTGEGKSGHAKAKSTEVKSGKKQKQKLHG